MPVLRPAAARAALVLLACGVGAGVLRAQAVCQGHPIREIRIYPVALISIEPHRFPRLVQQVGNAISWNTRARVIRRELRFQPGDPCDPLRLFETERILRAQPYIRSAMIATTPAPGDSVDVEVTTRDEWSLGGSLRVDTRSERPVRAARLTETNLMGLGMHAQLRYDDYGRKPGLVLDVLHPQLPGRTDAQLVAGRTSVGPVGDVSLRRTFESEYDWYAWRAGVRWREEPFVFQSSTYGNVVQPLVSAGADLGFVRRWGPFGRQALLGISLSEERLFAPAGVVASLPADDSAAAAAIAGRFTDRLRMSIDVVGGIRNIRFVPRAGIDAVNAPEDVREGYEIRVVGGAGFGAAWGMQKDRFALVDFYAGLPVGGTTLAFLRSRVEGRWLPDDHQWQNVIASTDLFTYTSLSARGVLVLGLQGAGGWHTSTPFQLQVAGSGGLRGFGGAGLPAGRRVVAQAEHRYYLGTVLGVADLGTSTFVDAGRGWAGDAAFGENTTTLVAVGAGLRIGFPVGSRLTTRLDVAFPVRGGHGAEVRFALRQQFGVTTPESMDIGRSRQPVGTIALFNFSRY